ncbi:FAD-dependent oxidoreductase [Streptomyces sp. NPDC057580]|uniref:FAD-dependent oxidoreductase n=1 Tax=Streptomyces sp. NPDC057580 TaxID=3346173 RepID=UPI0036A6C39D
MTVKEVCDRPLPREVDVVVLGSGAAGLMTALCAADQGLHVAVLESSARLGGTSAVSGGMLWVPCNKHMGSLGVEDSPEEALAYLRALTLGTVDEGRLSAFISTAPRVIDYLEEATTARFLAVMRPDYRPDQSGSKLGGRSLDNRPFDASPLRRWPVRRREMLPIVHEERRQMRTVRGAELVDSDVIRRRAAEGTWTLGAALVGALLVACIERGVTFHLNTTIADTTPSRHGGRNVTVSADSDGQSVRARRGVVLATGGFEWNPTWRASFLPGPDHYPVSPPLGRGDGIRLGLAAGGQTSSMTDAWWVPAIRVPGEVEEGHPRARHLSDELALPGSILVNRAGRRFVNEATNYNDLARVFAHFDVVEYSFVNDPCWVVFDEAFRSKYMMAGVSPADGPAAWWLQAQDLSELASTAGIGPLGLVRTVERFNIDALSGIDSSFSRGDSPHDRYYGDERSEGNPCLAPLQTPPYYCIPVRRGSFGSKGGLLTDHSGRVLDGSGEPIEGLWACGNNSAPVTGPGYPGAGATLASALTFGYLCGMDTAA